MEELLKLFNFSEDEIKSEKDRIKRAFKKAGIDSADIERAKLNARKYLDLELEGMRKIYGIWVREFIDLVLAGEEGKKIVYGIYPTFPTATDALMVMSEDVYVTSPEVVLDNVYGTLFGKINRLLRAAEDHGMPPARAHCSLLQARLGAIELGVMPVPDLLLATGFFCDQAPEIDELIHRIYDVPVVYTDRCMVAGAGEWPDINEREDVYLSETIEEAFEETGKIIDHEITEGDKDRGAGFLVQAILAHNGLAEYKMDKDPCPISMLDSYNFAFLGCATAMRRAYENNEIIKAHEMLLLEMRERVEEGKGVVEEGAPRVAINIPNWVDPSLQYMQEKEIGLAVPISHYEYFIDKEIPIVTSMEGMSYERYAGRVMLAKGIFHSIDAFIDYTKDLVEAGNCDGFLWEYPFSCRPLAITPYMVKKVLEEEYGIPTLALEGDKYDSRFYSAEQQRTRLETFAEILRERKEKSWQ